MVKRGKQKNAQKCAFFTSITKLGWGGGIRPAFRWRESQSNEHSSFVTFPCGLPLAILTPNVLGSAESFGSSNRPHPQDIENVPDHKDLGHFLWLNFTTKLEPISRKKCEPNPAA